MFSLLQVGYAHETNASHFELALLGEQRHTDSDSSHTMGILFFLEMHRKVYREFILGQSQELSNA
jgi:hypothetical protein